MSGCTGFDPSCGVVFRITPSGTYTVLHTFTGTDGSHPRGALIQASDGNLYGTTVAGGANQNSICIYAPGCGTIFRMTLSGKLKTLYSFCAKTNCADGDAPNAGMVEGTDGNFYGTAYLGGALTNVYCTTEGGGCGTVFKMTPAGVLATLHNFAGSPDGAQPAAELVQGADGLFYGTTFLGGSKVCIAGGCGTFFRISPTGKLTTLYRFCGKAQCPDGEGPEGAIAQGTDGNFYFTTTIGPFQGTIFSITPQNKATVLYSFTTAYPTGGTPFGGLIQGTDGNFYGTTDGEFNGGIGTVFSLNVGLGPFVETRPGFGKVGASIVVLGNNLTGTTNVSFSGTAAPFTVVSASEITAKVPAGATTGKVEVTTPSGTLSSNAVFRVRPQILSFSPTSGPAGTSVVITGVSFLQATAVAMAACKCLMSFTVNSDKQITAVVPPGATSGKIAVRTPGGRLESTANFTVTP